MKKTILALALLTIGFIGNAQSETDEIINKALLVRTTRDAVASFQTTDNTWLYTQWLDKSNTRKAYMGFNPSLTNFRLNLENGADRFTVNGGNVGIGNYNPVSPLHVSSNLDAIMTLQTTDNKWLYTQWMNKEGVRKAYIGFSPSLTNFRVNLENGADRFTINGGKVGIGTYNPDEELTVKGTIHCEEVLVDLKVPADYVFEKYYEGASTLKSTYTMPTLEEVEEFTKKNHHLPAMPSAAQIQEEGLQLKEMTNLLLQKIEELTLYTIEQEKRIKSLETQLDKQ